MASSVPNTKYKHFLTGCNYTCVEGQTSGSLLFVQGNHCYRVNKLNTKNPRQLYVKCKNRDKEGCMSTAKIENGYLSVEITKPHTCTSKAEDVDVLKFRSMIRKEVKKTTEAPKVLAERVMSTIPNGAALRYEQVKGIIYNARYASLPKTPPTIEALREAVDTLTGPFEKYLLGRVELPRKGICFFYVLSLFEMAFSRPKVSMLG